MNIEEFWNSPEILTIHCNTEEKANKLLKKFDKFGKKWISSERYNADNFFRVYKGQTCYTNNNTFANFCWAKKNRIKVIEFNELDEFKPKPKSKILDDIEFYYLWNIIKPFRKKVEYIEKLCMNDKYFIGIELKDCTIVLPYFDKDSSMYKVMELGKSYTLEELGLANVKKDKILSY